MTKFKPGDCIRTQYGNIDIVVESNDCQVWLRQDTHNWYHPSKLHKTKCRKEE